MGTHTNCPSHAVRPGLPEMPLLDWVQQNPNSLGSEVREYFKDSLPFLFKVLSVRTSLSIQAHPNKVHAEKLHQEQPEIYKDPNHKPEMAIALTPFIGLCGFRPIEEVVDFFKDIPELTAAVGSKHAMKLVGASCVVDSELKREAMKDCFQGLLETHRDTVMQELDKLVKRILVMQKEKQDLKAVEGETILKLHSEFPGDPGAFCVYFLNLVHLDPGEAMFLEANLPHAYLSGDCMECMACSDNVVRAGLTPKFIDKHTLVEMLDYSGRPASTTKFSGIQTTDHISTTIFRPPVPDFGVTKFEVPQGVKEFKLNAFESASICIVIRGQGQASNATLKAPLALRRGSVFFIAAKQEVGVMVTGDGDMLLFQAYAGLP
ncbi:mannose-6-phosphate isomerase-like isoform X2 [Babylonia areolata]